MRVQRFRCRGSGAATPRLLAALAVSCLFAACAQQSPTLPAYTFSVPLDTTYDLNSGQVLTPQQQGQRLAAQGPQPVRLLFLGEHHEDPRSHEAQLRLLRAARETGRPLLVALEMFPPQADPALEDWRQGRLTEVQFLEQSHWYETWGYPWSLYRGLFEYLRQEHIPLRGVNADAAAVKAAREGRLENLPAAEQDEIGTLDVSLAPHQQYLLDALRQGGHGNNLAGDSPQFAGMARVQALWERLMGVRAERLAQAQPAEGLVVVLIGSGHLAYKLGANLQAARAGNLPQLSLWDDIVPPGALNAQGQARVPVGMADWVRVYAEDSAQTQYPSLAGLRLSAAAQGVRVEQRGAFADPSLSGLRAGDTITALNGQAAGSPVALRLAFEALPWGHPARLRVLRGGQTLELTVIPRRAP